MLAAINTVLKHDGHEYHVNCEDLGDAEGCIVIRILDKGGILWEKRFPHPEAVTAAEGKREAEQALRSQMAKTVQTVEAAIAKGRLP